MVKVGVVGCSGRMGVEVIGAIIDCDNSTLSAAVARNQVGKDVGIGIGKITGVKASDSVLSVFKCSDVVIDFSSADGLKECLDASIETKVPFVSGTTGHDLRDVMHRVSGEVAVLWASNMSFGISLLNIIVEDTAHNLDDSYDAEVIEMHHSKKKDAPSGTSLTLADHVAKGRGVKLDIKTDRSGVRKKGEIGFSISRCGGVIGQHSVVFADEFEMITLSHHALDRAVFANGALKAALWLYDKKPGLYSIQNVIADGR